MRPSMLETGLEVMAYNINRKMQRLKFYEFGKLTAAPKWESIQSATIWPCTLAANLPKRLAAQIPKSGFLLRKSGCRKIMTLTGAKRVSYEPAEAPGFDGIF